MRCCTYASILLSCAAVSATASHWHMLHGDLKLPNSTSLRRGVRVKPSATRTASQEKIVRFTGESKAGTTWATVLAYTAVKELCPEEQSLDKCWRDGVFPAVQDGYTNFAYFTAQGVNITFDQSAKHVLPGGSMDDPSCFHPTTFAWSPPCDLTPDANAGDVDLCAERCWGSRVTTDETVLMIDRDPRDGVVSECFHLNQDFPHVSEERVPGLLEECVKRNYFTMVSWVRMRALWSKMLRLSGSEVFVLTYDGLLNNPDKELRTLIASLGLKANKWERQKIAEECTPSGMAARDGKDLYIGHRSREQSFHFVRSAGAETYMDYNMSQPTISWMDKLFDEMVASRA